MEQDTDEVRGSDIDGVEPSIERADFEEGDTVLVKMRCEGSLRAKFVATCEGFHVFRHGSPKAMLSLDFIESPQIISLRLYEAEFEVLDDPSEARF